MSSPPPSPAIVWLGPFLGTYTKKTVMALLRRLLKDDISKVSAVDLGPEDVFLEASRTRGLELPWEKDRKKLRPGDTVLEARLTVAGGRAAAKRIARELRAERGAGVSGRREVQSEVHLDAQGSAANKSFSYTSGEDSD